MGDSVSQVGPFGLVMQSGEVEGRGDPQVERRVGRGRTGLQGWGEQSSEVAQDQFQGA